MELNLKGKVALVTGGGTGIGAGISDYLAEEGVQVAVNYIVDEPAAVAFAAELTRKYRTHAIAVYGDVSKPADADAMIAETVRELGRIDILVNNAGIWPTEDVLAMSDSSWERVIDVNLNGPFYLARRVAQALVAAGRQGTIVNVSSKSGFQVSTGGHAHYATAKAGVAMLTRALARELTGKGVRVVGVAPGMVRTPINEEKWRREGLLDSYVSRIPTGRFTEPRELGYLVAFLCSDKAFNVVGTTVDCTGGMLI
jgi:NAD(P)-dependent dehydrogenase (short-subunit alcohol dehydrogenase family)